jgi:hypothetical protein
VSGVLDSTHLDKFVVTNGTLSDGRITGKTLYRSGINFQYSYTSAGGVVDYIPSIVFFADEGEGEGTQRGVELTFFNSNIRLGKFYDNVDFDLGSYIGYLNNAYIKTIYYNTLVQNSSKDIKHDIQPLPSVGDKLDELKPVTFVYDDDKNEKVRFGLIYEDTVEVLPEICTDDESNKAINYVELIPMLLKEIQDLRARVKALEEREVE